MTPIDARGRASASAAPESPRRVVVLGTGAPDVPGALREPAGATLADLEELLEAPPEVAIAGGTGEACLFRASLALERGVRTVLVGPGALPDAWLADLGARAEEMGAAVAVPDGRGYRRVRGRRSEGVDPGAPAAAAWTARAGETAFTVEPGGRGTDGGSLLGEDDTARALPPRLEEVAFAAGLKPVLYLVVPAVEAAAVRARHAGAQTVERADRLSVDPPTGVRAGDPEGTRVTHLFLAAERRDAERAAALWSEGSTRHLREIGALMGYPGCCAAAFAALPSRANNAALVYVTAARTRALAGEFHPLLNQPVARLAPFTPCTFGCRRAIGWAERVLDALGPDIAARLRQRLARPVLYLDEVRAVVLDGARLEGDAVRFTAARFLPREPPGADASSRRARAFFASALAGGGLLRLADDALEVGGGGTAPRRFSRGTPPLGVLLPFAPRA